MSDTCHIEATAPAFFVLHGELSFTTVMDLSRRSAPLLWQDESVTLDLAGVTRTDSAGLALLIEWLRMAHRNGKAIWFRNIPPQMMAVAAVVGLDELLPVASP
jgi:phospholipid transport system transporter-binding protein